MIMKYPREAKLVLVAQLVSIIFAAVAGALAGGAGHNMLGACLGSFLGFFLPPVVACFRAERSKGAGSPFMKPMAAVGENKWLGQQDRDMVEGLRASGVLSVFALSLCVLGVGLFLSTQVSHRLAAGALGALLFGILALPREGRAKNTPPN